jgi:L-glyceraldehyde 3-phosphate reductase
MALAWVLRGERITTALIGASSTKQVVDCAGAVERLDFTESELSRIDKLSGDMGINLWAESSETEN